MQDNFCHLNSSKDKYQSTYFIEYFMQGNFRYPRINKIHQILEKITRIDQESQNPLSCSHMNCCLQKYTTYQFTYFIYYLFQDKFKNPKIIKIQQVHQKIHTKQFLLFYLNCFLFVVHLNLKKLEKHD